MLQLLEPPSYDKLYSMLQEREQDLELAARIGQALLHRAHQLDSDLLTASDLRSLAEQQAMPPSPSPFTPSHLLPLNHTSLSHLPLSHTHLSPAAAVVSAASRSLPQGQSPPALRL